MPETISLDEMFAPDGPIASSFGRYEPRREQVEMAQAIQNSLSDKNHLIVEAGTGVGKSAAYLLPCALWAVQEKKKAVVATFTKALQEQLIENDLPIIQTAIQKVGLEFKYALLMGSENYLCKRRLNYCFQKGHDLFETYFPAETLQKLIGWASRANTGLRTKIPFEIQDSVWEMVCRDSELCRGKDCPDRESCLHRKDVSRASHSEVVVANQHLFLAGIPIPSFDVVVFDEAHNLEEVASQFLGFSLTDRMIKRLLETIYNPMTGRGLAKRLGPRNNTWLKDVEEKITEVQFAKSTFFEEIRSKLGLDALKGDSRESKAKRIREANIVQDTLSGPIETIAELLSKATTQSEKPEEKEEIEKYYKRCLKISEHIKEFIKCESQDHVYWVEENLFRKDIITSLNKAPLDVSKELKREVFEKHHPVILTSATLTVDDTFKMVKSRLGLDSGDEKLLYSPFDYQAQAAIYIDTEVPDPRQEPEAYERMVIKRCLEICEMIPGGVFVLFTNWQLLEKASKEIKNSLSCRPVFKQGDTPPNELLGEFKRSGNGILLGTDTFWQGVDVQGKALMGVIITRLPFLSPDSPLEEARQEWMTKRGMDIFKEYTLPKAVIKFRQGFGRLIRAKTDYGVVAILDPRIQTKRYGASFLRSIPRCKRVNTLKELQEFLQSKEASTPLSSREEEFIVTLVSNWNGKLPRSSAANVLRGGKGSDVIVKYGTEPFGRHYGSLKGIDYHKIIEMIDALIERGALNLIDGKLCLSSRGSPISIKPAQWDESLRKAILGVVKSYPCDSLTQTDIARLLTGLGSSRKAKRLNLSLDPRFGNFSKLPTRTIRELISTMVLEGDLEYAPKLGTFLGQRRLRASDFKHSDQAVKERV